MIKFSIPVSILNSSVSWKLASWLAVSKIWVYSTTDSALIQLDVFQCVFSPLALWITVTNHSSFTIYIHILLQNNVYKSYSTRLTYIAISAIFYVALCWHSWDLLGICRIERDRRSQPDMRKDTVVFYSVI